MRCVIITLKLVWIFMMKVTRKQLEYLIKEYLGNNKSILIEGIEGTFLSGQITKLGASPESAEKINSFVNVIDDALGKSKSVDEYLVKFAKEASDTGLSVAKAMSAVRTVAYAYAILEFYMIIPKQIIATLEYLSTVDGTLRNRFKYNKNHVGYHDWADRIDKYGLSITDIDPNSNVYSQLGSRFGIPEYTPDDMINQLALDLINVDNKDPFNVTLKGYQSKGKQSAIVYQLESDGIISKEFKDEVKKRAIDLGRKIKSSKKRLASDIVGVLINKISNGIKEGKKPNVLHDTISPLWNMIAPVDVNITRMFVETVAKEVTT